MKETIEFTRFRPDRSSPKALHLQLADELLKQLRALPPNENMVLPSERTLVKELEINRMTVHRAYAYLLENRLVVRNPDKSLSVSRTARKQLQGSFPVIGIILPEKFSIYARRQISLEYLKGIFDRATELGVSTMMLTPPPPGCDESTVDEFIGTHCAKLSGIIHLGSRGFESDNVFEKIIDYTGVPQLFISGDSDRPHIGSICIDPTGGGSALCQKFRERGVNKVAIIRSRKYHDPLFVYRSKYRAGQMENIFRENGFEISCVSTFDSADKIDTDTSNLPDAFWCHNDEYAKALIKFLNDRDIRVPEDVMVAGFDGIENSFGNMKITTIDHRLYDIGYSAVDLILEHYEFGITGQNRVKMIESFLIPGDTL